MRYLLGYHYSFPKDVNLSADYHVLMTDDKRIFVVLKIMSITILLVLFLYVVYVNCKHKYICIYYFTAYNFQCSFMISTHHRFGSCIYFNGEATITNFHTSFST